MHDIRSGFRSILDDDNLGGSIIYDLSILNEVFWWIYGHHWDIKADIFHEQVLRYIFFLINKCFW